MSNKSTIKENTKNSVFTPEDVTEALEHLPYQYVGPVQDILERKKAEGKLEQVYSHEWIRKVKKGEAFNEDILEALVQVGRDEMAKLARFGRKKEKTPSTN